MTHPIHSGEDVAVSRANFVESQNHRTIKVGKDL